MNDRHKLEAIFQKHGYSDFKWIDPKEFVVAHWVRMKCMFGCEGYGRGASCPPNVPSVEDCQKFFEDYSDASIFHFKKAVAKPDDRHDWTRDLNKKLLDLEKEVFFSGYEKAFLLLLSTCNICKSCRDTRDECKEPLLSRPTPEALALDVFSTVRKVGYSIEVLSDYSQEMNRFAFLLVK